MHSAFRATGPGVIAGAADDDPSAITAFSIAGSQLGNGLLWFSWLSWPLMHAVQMMCARVGMVTGRGLIGALHAKLPRPLLVIASLALLIANTINIGADLSGMAEAAALVTGMAPWLFVILFGLFITFATLKLPYRKIARMLQWLALSLFAYVASAIRVVPDWSAVLRDTFTIHVPHGGWPVILALIGSTFSPYFFIWQASQEVEEKRDIRGGKNLQGTRWDDLLHRRIDVGIGTFFSRVVLFFVVLTTSMTLRGTTIASAADAAQALAPVAGPAARWLYTIGLLGVGFLVIPVLSSGAAYAFAEVFEWRHGLNEPPQQARRFYGVILLSTLGGIAMQFTKISSVQALFWSGVINGVIAPFLLAAVLLVSADRQLMGGRPSGRLERITVAAAVAAMLAALLAWVG